MKNLEKYQATFSNVLGVPVEELNENFTYANQEAWDSVVHMMLIAELEEQFDIEFDMDDIVELSSYEKGKEILAKYNITF